MGSQIDNKNVYHVMSTVGSDANVPNEPISFKVVRNLPIMQNPEEYEVTVSKFVLDATNIKRTIEKLQLTMMLDNYVPIPNGDVPHNDGSISQDRYQTFVAQYDDLEEIFSDIALMSTSKTRLATQLTTTIGKLYRDFLNQLTVPFYNNALEKIVINNQFLTYNDSTFFNTLSSTSHVPNRPIWATSGITQMKLSFRNIVESSGFDHPDYWEYPATFNVKLTNNSTLQSVVLLRNITLPALQNVDIYDYATKNYNEVDFNNRYFSNEIIEVAPLQPMSLILEEQATTQFPLKLEIRPSYQTNNPVGAATYQAYTFQIDVHMDYFIINNHHMSLLPPMVTYNKSDDTFAMVSTPSFILSGVKIGLNQSLKNLINLPTSATAKSLTGLDPFFILNTQHISNTFQANERETYLANEPLISDNNATPISEGSLVGIRFHSTLPVVQTVNGDSLMSTSSILTEFFIDEKDIPSDYLKYTFDYLSNRVFAFSSVDHLDEFSVTPRAVYFPDTEREILKNTNNEKSYNALTLCFIPRLRPQQNKRRRLDTIE